ncbi:MAG: ribosome biogenesis GTP-binding protein YihA/YsxC [Steroidobacteraceae bacterium]|jgi:GTP-binding protein|nr:ribosome biogenesis GTP-binding protein YihA/YsxC [Steroidobacteraceae bacterium]
MSAFPHAKYLLGAHEPHQFVPDEGAEVAFAGRSNSGKSSAINAVTQRHSLARTSRTPGQTQLVNFFELEPGRRLVDLPGYGFAKVPPKLQKHWERLLGQYFGERESLRALFVIMDVRHPLTDHDWRMIEYARTRGRGLHLLLTKADKVSRGAGMATLAQVRREVGGTATAQLFSALDKTGVDEARRVLKQWLKENARGPEVPGPD